MSLPSKARKAKGVDTIQIQGKTAKPLPDIKQDAMKPEKVQPTAEQIRIAQIIDTKSEDPSLKEKIKQVMDATQKSIEDVYTALHDCDNDPNRAVNYLLEGIESEWSTSSKKKKNRTSSEKGGKEKEQPPAPEPAPVEESKNIKPAVKNKPPAPRARGRPFRGGRGGSTTFQKTDNFDRGRRGKVLNGPSRGRGSRGRIQTRGYGRIRGNFRRPPIDTWNPQKPISNVFNHDTTHTDDWDNEEYTGSLATSQIFTSSGSGTSPPAINNAIHSINNSASSDFNKNRHSHGDSSNLQFLVKMTVAVNDNGSNKQSEITSVPRPFKQFSPIPSIPAPSLTPPSHIRTSPVPINGSLMILSSRTERALEKQDIRLQRTSRPKIPPPSKIPSSAVVMPPDLLENNIALLDVQFGGMELNDNFTDSFGVSPPSPCHSPTSPSSEKLLPHQSVTTSEALILNESSFSPIRNSGSTSLSQMSDLTCKVSDVSPGLYQESSYQNIPYSKGTQQSPSIYNPSYPNSQKAWLNISTGSEETPSDDVTREEEEWKLLSSAAPPMSTQFNDYEGAENDVTVRAVLNSGAQQIPSEEHHNQEQQVEDVMASSTRKEVNSTSSIIYSTSSSQNTYSSSTGAVYGTNTTYPHYPYSNYHSHPNQSLPMMPNSSNSYQSGLSSLQYGTNTQSVYGTSVIPTPSYTAPYQPFNSSLQHNHKPTLLSTSTNSKEFETSQPAVNLSSIAHSGSMNPTQTLLSTSQTTPTTKPANLSSTNLPPGVAPLVGTQYINVQGVPYFQQPVYYDELQLMQQQRIPPHISTGYYEMGYPTATTREGVQYNMTDARFARADNSSPVQASTINQQSGTQAHQQPMLNPPAIPHQPYAYFYGSSAAMIPGNFQYGAHATLYPMAAGSTNSGHGNANSGVYGKAPNNFAGNYAGNYENSQQANNVSATDFKSSTSSVPKSQPTQSANPSSSSDLTNIYSKPLSKSYEKQGFHCATPPPFNLGSQNSAMPPSGGYAQHLFIPALAPHHSTPALMHQPIHQDGPNNMNVRSQGGNQQPKVVMTKANYNSSTYWTPN